MSRYKVAAGLAALALSAAVVTALAGSRPDVGADAVPQVTADVAPEMKPNPAAEARGDVAPELTPDVAPAAKGDRLALRVVKPDPRLAKPDARSAKPDPRPVVSACPVEPWPFGCQWRERPRKVIRASRPS
jgi:hypothetical protein